MTTKKSSVSFHDQPSTGNQSRYQSVIAKAKARQKDKPGNLSSTPRFDEVGTSWQKEDVTRPDPLQKLSDTTAAALDATFRATAAATDDEVEQEADNEPAAQASAVQEEDEMLTEDEKIRKAVESRLLDGIDIGQYLMNGEVTQMVTIIPGKLEVTYRTVTDLEEVWVDAKMAELKEATGRQVIRAMNEWSLATHILSVNGTGWPNVVKGDGTINDKTMERRLGHVRKLSSPIFTLMVQSLGWFLDRVQKQLTLETLGNG